MIFHSNCHEWDVMCKTQINNQWCLSHGRILDIFLPGLKHSKVENPFYISASTSILDPNKTILILIRQGRSPASPYGAYAYAQMHVFKIKVYLSAIKISFIISIYELCRLKINKHPSNVKFWIEMRFLNDHYQILI